MGKVFEWLDRRSGEAVPAYDKRINSLAAFHAGYAFFSSENYHKELSAFAMYAVWNNELNAKLETPLPNGGFMLHCDRAQAFEFLRYGDGYPVFIRLKSKLGRLYAEHLLLSDRDKLFDLYYNGCEVIPPESTCFRHYKAPNDPHFNEAGEGEETEERTLPGTYNAGSYMTGSYMTGSYMTGSYMHGSYRRRRNFGGSFVYGGYRTGSFYGGSFRLGGFIGFGGSYAYGSYRAGLTSYRSFSQFGSYRFWGNLTGSYRSFYGSYGGALGSFLGGFFAGSFRLGSFSLGSFLIGSYRLGSYSIGSYSAGSYYGGSYQRHFYNGSYYGGSYHRGSYVYGGCAGVVSANEDTGYVEDIMFPGEDSIIVLRGDIPIRRLIEEMGYGLDLI